jgi:tRNA threonylcarbamoyladenosine biosynthesis protein TsaE
VWWFDNRNSSNNLSIVKTLSWPDETATAAFAQQLAQALCRTPAAPRVAGHDVPAAGVHAALDAATPAAPRPSACVALHGNLGAGKTTFVRHLLRALGVTGRIKSPTYAVVEPYEVTALAHPLHIWHFDFYRFSDPREWEDAGFRDLFASPGLKLCEWPEHAQGVMPTPDLDLHIEVDTDSQRQVTLHANTHLGESLLA